MKRLVFAAIATMSIGLAGISRADVVVVHKSNGEMMGMMSTQMEGTDQIKGDRSYTEATMKMTSSIPLLGKGKPQEMINITRLDRGVVWALDPQNKTYNETTFESMKEMLAKSKQDAEKDTAESKYVWTADVRTVDQPQEINGFNCKGVIGKAVGVNKKDASDTVTVTYEQWLGQNVPGAAEMEQFHKNYAKAMGVDEIWAEKGMGEILKDYGAQFETLAKKVGEVGGFPIKTVVSVESSVANRSAAKSGGQESGDEGVAGMMGKMSGMFGKKKSQEKKEEVGSTKTFFMITEVLSVEQKGIDDSQFDIPAGYKRK